MTPSSGLPRPSPERWRCRWGAAALLAACLAVAACSSGPAAGIGDAGSVDRAAPTDVAFVDPRAVICTDPGATEPTFALVQRIFDSECVSCHTVGNDLVLSADVSWTNLVGRAAPESCGGVLVAPGDPPGSYLYEKLSADRPCSGRRMPNGEFGPVPLPDCVVAIVRRWIASGAFGLGDDAGRD